MNRILRLATMTVAVLLLWPPRLHSQCGSFRRATTTPTSAADASPYLVTPSALAILLESDHPVVLHAAADRAGYDKGHVPGARFVPASAFAPARNGLAVELPPVDQLVTVLEGMGVGDSTRIVITGDLLWATRLFFTLDYLGLAERASLLDGGLEVWREAGQRVVSAEPPPAVKTTLTVRPRPDVVVDAAWVETHRAGAGVSIVDARSPEEFRGEKGGDGVPRPGHIPGARHVDWTTALLPDGRLAPPVRLTALLGSAGVGATDTVAAYCRVGHRASMLYFVARVLGLPARLYDGSFEEWSRAAGRPVEP